MSAFDTYHRIWFLTWTTYGTWLPGDSRGYVSPKFDTKEPEPLEYIAVAICEYKEVAKILREFLQ